MVGFWSATTTWSPRIDRASQNWLLEAAAGKRSATLEWAVKSFQGHCAQSVTMLPFRFIVPSLIEEVSRGPLCIQIDVNLDRARIHRGLHLRTRLSLANTFLSLSEIDLTFGDLESPDDPARRGDRAIFEDPLEI